MKKTIETIKILAAYASTVVIGYWLAWQIWASGVVR